MKIVAGGQVVDFQGPLNSYLRFKNVQLRKEEGRVAAEARLRAEEREKTRFDIAIQKEMDRLEDRPGEQESKRLSRERANIRFEQGQTDRPLDKEAKSNALERQRIKDQQANVRAATSQAARERSEGREVERLGFAREGAERARIKSNTERTSKGPGQAAALLKIFPQTRPLNRDERVTQRNVGRVAEFHGFNDEIQDDLFEQTPAGDVNTIPMRLIKNLQKETGLSPLELGVIQPTDQIARQRNIIQTIVEADQRNEELFALGEITEDIFSDRRERALLRLQLIAESDVEFAGSPALKQIMQRMAGGDTLQGENSIGSLLTNKETEGGGLLDLLKGLLPGGGE